MKKKSKKVIGWREWVKLPGLDISKIKVKVDTGARTSSIHAIDLIYFKKSGKDYVRFKVHPIQKNSKKVVRCVAKVLEFRNVKSSNGHTQKRPVIVTPIELLGEVWEIEITLTNRDEMGFRMLLGRESIKKKFLVDVSSSFFSEKQKEIKKEAL
jgi:hypothetical protein